MRFGLFSLLEQPDDTTPERAFQNTLDHFVYGEELGFDSAWVAEHHFHAYGTCGSPATFLSALATRTRRIRLGPAVAILTLHNPVQIAEDYAVVDVLSGGRLELGAGRGYQPSELAGFGVPMSETRDRFDEALEILELAWSGKEFSYEGRWHSFERVRTYPEPVQRPAPPVFLASISAETFALVRERPGRYGIAASLLTSGFSTVRQGINTFVDSLDPGEERDISLVVPAYVGSSNEEAFDTAVRYMSWYFDTVKHLLPGAMGEELDPSYKDYAGLSQASANIDMAKFTRRFPIGDVEHSTERLLALLKEIPVNRVVLWMNIGGMPPRLVRASMERMIEQVIPAVRRELATRPEVGTATPT